jgi:Zn-dependent protease
MFGKRISVFKLLGFEVRIDLSWLIVAVLIVWSLGSVVFPYYFTGFAPATYWAMAAFGAVGFFLSIILHELSHALVARRFGLPIHGITLFIFGGVAEMKEEPPSAKAEFLMAIAGPLASILIGLGCLGLERLLGGLNTPPAITLVLHYLFIINIVLAVFNLIPAYPLDGGRVLRAALWQWRHSLSWATHVAANVGSFFGILLIVFGFLSVIGGAFISGLWWMLIGLFVRNAAQMSYQSMMLRQYLEGEAIRRFMSTAPISVPHSTPIDELVEQFFLKYHFRLFPVSGNRVLKCITLHDVKQIPREEWPAHIVAEYAQPASADNSISIDADALKALTVMNQTGNRRLMVIDEEGNLAGIITLRDLFQFISLKLDLAGESSVSLPRIREDDD